MVIFSPRVADVEGSFEEVVKRLRVLPVCFATDKLSGIHPLEPTT